MGLQSKIHWQKTARSTGRNSENKCFVCAGNEIIKGRTKGTTSRVGGRVQRSQVARRVSVRRQHALDRRVRQRLQPLHRRVQDVVGCAAGVAGDVEGADSVDKLPGCCCAQQKRLGQAETVSHHATKAPPLHIRILRRKCFQQVRKCFQ